MSGKLVLVTGASGFIATHIVQQLQQAGYRVRGTVRSLKNEDRVKPLRNLCPDADYPIELVEADLTSERGWAEAVQDCDYIMHTASPFPAEEPKHEDELIKPAVEGTLNVLRAIRQTKCVRRCVLTSSSVAVFGSNFGEGGKTYSEDDWTDPEKKGLEAYAKSKTMAEKAAWDFANTITDESEKFELAVSNPVLVIGPVLCGGFGTSMDIPKRLLNREMPMLANLSIPIVDVRDVAKAHVQAMLVPEAAGHRHCLYSQTVWLKEVAQFLSDEFKSQGYNIPMTVAPNCMIWILARFSKMARLMYPLLGEICYIRNDRMKNVLAIEPIEARRSYVDMAYSMIERGIVRKTRKYKGPPADRSN